MGIRSRISEEMAVKMTVLKYIGKIHARRLSNTERRLCISQKDMAEGTSGAD